MRHVRRVDPDALDRSLHVFCLGWELDLLQGLVNRADGRTSDGMAIILCLHIRRMFLLISAIFTLPPG